MAYYELFPLRVFRKSAVLLLSKIKAGNWQNHGTDAIRDLGNSSLRFTSRQWLKQMAETSSASDSSPSLPILCRHCILNGFVVRSYLPNRLFPLFASDVVSHSSAIAQFQTNLPGRVRYLLRLFKARIGAKLILFPDVVDWIDIERIVSRLGNRIVTRFVFSKDILKG